MASSSLSNVASERRLPILALLFVLLFLISFFTISTNPLSSFSFSQSVANPNPNSDPNPNPDPNPIEVQNSDPNPVEIENSDPNPVEIENSDPNPIKVQNSDPNPTEVQTERTREEEVVEQEEEEEGGLEIKWRRCRNADYIPCLDNMEAIKALKSRRHMEHRERHCPQPPPRCIARVPNGYRTPVPWPKSRDMVRSLTILW